MENHVNELIEPCAARDSAIPLGDQGTEMRTNASHRSGYDHFASHTHTKTYKAKPSHAVECLELTLECSPVAHIKCIDHNALKCCKLTPSL